MWAKHKGSEQWTHLWISELRGLQIDDRVLVILCERIPSIRAVRNVLRLVLFGVQSVDGYHPVARLDIVLEEAGSVVAVDDDGAGEDALAGLLRCESDGMVVPRITVLGSSVSPVLIASDRLVGIVLEVEVEKTVVVDEEPIGIVHESGARTVVDLRSIVLLVHSCEGLVTVAGSTGVVLPVSKLVHLHRLAERLCEHRRGDGRHRGCCPQDALHTHADKSLSDVQGTGLWVTATWRGWSSSVRGGRRAGRSGDWRVADWRAPLIRSDPSDA